MSYPTLEQYTEALQHPQLALKDPELSNGIISTTGLGLPLALCGGFALTYTITNNGKKYAVRCFHKHSNALEQRYRAISNRIKGLKSPYFLDFEYQPQGVRINGNMFPVVKMLWASGETLGEFLEHNYRNKINLQQLNTSLRTLAKYLEDQSIAHGDIQTGNVMVANNGRSVQLIDYDGMYVDDLRTLNSAELGHRNFQHPARNADYWSPVLDRFSFIALSLALRILETHPEMWLKTQSDGDSILFKANDFVNPAQSIAFRDLFSLSEYSEDAKNFAAICLAPFNKIPTLEDFITRKNIPPYLITVPKTPETPPIYFSAYPVLDALDYSFCLKYVGDRVELIGHIVEVKQGRTKYGKGYIFINFGPWQGNIVKVSIWSEGLLVIPQKPDKSWVGLWISAVGLLETPYRSKKYHYSHLSISITQSNQLHIITDSEAKFRLASKNNYRGATTPRNTNEDVLREMQGKKSTSANRSTGSSSTRNQDILNDMKSKIPGTVQGQVPGRSGQPTMTKSGTGEQNGCLWIIAIVIILIILRLFLS